MKAALKHTHTHTHTLPTHPVTIQSMRAAHPGASPRSCPPQAHAPLCPGGIPSLRPQG